MQKLKTAKLKNKKKPKGWELIETPLMEFSKRMRDLENTPCEGKRKPEVLWPIFRLHH